MRVLLPAWTASGIVAVLAILAMKALAPEAENGLPFDEYADVLRVHLPWLLSSVLMAFVAGGQVREQPSGLLRSLAAVPVPLAAAPAAILAGAWVPETAAAVVLFLTETVLGIVLGTFLAGILGTGRESGGSRAREGDLWRRSRWE